MNKLPPLPEPALTHDRLGHPLLIGPTFTASQLRERDRQIVEMCAQIAEDTHPNEWAFIGSAIRSLLEDGNA